VKGLTHSHEDKIAEPTSRCDFVENPACMKHLGDDLAGPEVPDESPLTRGAKDTTHRTSRLGADTNGVASGVAHQDRLDGLPVAEAEEKLPRETIVTPDFLDEFRCLEKIGFSLSHRPVHPSAERRSKGFQRKVGNALAMKGSPERFCMTRVHPVRDEDLPEAGEVGIMEGFLFGLIHELRQHMQAVSTKENVVQQKIRNEPA